MRTATLTWFDLLNLGQYIGLTTSPGVKLHPFEFRLHLKSLKGFIPGVVLVAVQLNKISIISKSTIALGIDNWKCLFYFPEVISPGCLPRNIWALVNGLCLPNLPSALRWRNKCTFDIWNHTSTKTLQPKSCSLSLRILPTVSLIKIITGAEWFLMEVTQKASEYLCSGICAPLGKFTVHLVPGSPKMPHQTCQGEVEPKCVYP